MKLLLTSAGITNELLADALHSLIRGGFKKVGFVTTAANVEPKGKDWYIAQLTNLQQAGFDYVDIVDPSADGVDWRSRLGEVDVVVISGGNTFHLLDQARKTGFDEWIQENLESKVFVGISAGSILFTPTIAVAAIDDGDENIPGIADHTGLCLVDFEVSPHTPEAVSMNANREYADTIENKLYCYDDESAVQVVDTEVSVVSGAVYEVLD